MTETVTVPVNDKAIAIARDTLDHMDDYRFVNNAYMYGEIPNDCLAGDLKDYVDDVAKHCQVCLMGGFLLSKAKLFNNVPMKALVAGGRLFRQPPRTYVTVQREQVVQALLDCMGREQLDLIEAAFMRSSSAVEDWLENEPKPDGYEERLDSAVEFGSRRPGQQKRVHDVLANLIYHRGVFTPEDDPVSV